MRKVLSFVLVLALVLSSFSMAFATETSADVLSDISGIANEQAIEVAYNLGIVTGNPDGTYLPEKAVTRAEFAAMITRALGVPESALAGYTTTSFKDTTGYTWAVPYLAFCNSKGIMLGDGAGNAMPGKTIAVNEAMTMVLRAVGYTSNSSVLVGTWPSNYVTLAQDKDLYKDVSAATTVTKDNAAQIIYNALTVAKVQVASDGTTVYVTGNPNMLTSGLNCTKTPGYTVTGNEDTVINVFKYVGQYGDVYFNDDDEVISFVPDCTALVGTYNDLTWYSKFNTTDADVDYTNKQTTTTGIDFFANGETMTSVPGIPTTGVEYVLYADVTGKTINEIYSVMVWTADEDEMVTASQLKDIADDDSFLGKDFILDDDDNIDYNEFFLVGATSLDKIAADDVVYVYANADGEIRKIEVGTETVTGAVKDFKAIDKAFKIDAAKYFNAATIINGLENNDNITVEEVSDTVTAYLDTRGYVYSFDNDTTKSDTIAFVDAKDSTGIQYQARLILNDGTEKVLVAKNSTEYGKLTADKLVKYGLNKDGEISSVQTVADGYNALSMTTSVAVNFTTNSLVKGVSGAATVIKDSVIVFTYDGATVADTTNGYDVTTIDKVTKGDNLTHEAQFLLDDKNKIIAIMISEDDCKGGSDDVYALVNDVYTTSDADGDKVQRLEGFGDGAKIDVLTDDDTTLSGLAGTVNYTSDTAEFNPQVYALKLNADGTVTKAEQITTTDAGVKIHTTDAATVLTADGRNSVNDEALSKSVIIYEVNSDNEYKLYTGDLKEGDIFVLYETDDDADGYDIVVICRVGRI